MQRYLILSMLFVSCLFLTVLASSDMFGQENKLELTPSFTLTVNRRSKLPRFRGMEVVDMHVSKEDLITLGKWNVNLVRWQLSRSDPSADNTDLKAYDVWLEQALSRLDSLLPVCKKAGIKVVIDLHSTPGGTNYVKAIFTDKESRQKFFEVWDRIARHYKNNNIIWGYDLVNEPVIQTTISGSFDYHDLVEMTAKNIREIDKKHKIIVEPPIWATPAGIIGFKPISVNNVIYSVHMYASHAFTHQGINEYQGIMLTYPGIINGIYWDKNKLYDILQPVIDFQKKYGAHIYIGEFSAIRWAPNNSAYNYLKDVIDIFEENGWDWTYHAFREWHGWSVEHTREREDRSPSQMPTDRELLIRSWFEKNSKPSFDSK